MFILNESMMNGTVVMESYISIVNTDNFEKAVSKVKEKLLELNVTILIDTSKRFSYTIKSNHFPVVGTMRNEKPVIIEV